MWRDGSQSDVLALILSCWIPAFWTASCLWRKSFSSSCLAESSLSVSGCPLGGGLEGSCRPPLRLDLEHAQLMWGARWGLLVWAVGLCALLGQGKGILFGGAKPLRALRARDLVALEKTPRYPLRRKWDFQNEHAKYTALQIPIKQHLTHGYDQNHKTKGKHKDRTHLKEEAVVLRSTKTRQVQDPMQKSSVWLQFRWREEDINKEWTGEASADHWAATVLSKNTYDHVSKCTVRFCFCKRPCRKQWGKKKKVTAQN